jgi:plasmid stabilization system protein ParE
VTVVWTADAEEDRADILHFIAADDPTAAARIERSSMTRRPGWLRIRGWAGPV